MRHLLSVLIMIAAFTSTGFGQDRAKTFTQILITNVSVFDGTNEQLKDGPVLIENNLIKASGAGAKASLDAVVVDGGGCTLMPGLIDCHTHLNITTSASGIEAMPWDSIGARSVVMAKEWLMDGFTTVRDMGGMGGKGLKRVVDSGDLPGPRIYPSGAFLTQTSGHADLRSESMRNSGLTGHTDSSAERLGLTAVVDGRSRVLAATRQNLSQGASQIKLMAGGGVASQLDPVHTFGFLPEEISAAVAAAKDFDTYVAVHVFTDEGIQRSLNAGVMSIEHGFFIEREGMELLIKKGAFLSAQMTGISTELAKNPVLPPLSLKKLAYANTQSQNFVRLIKEMKPKLVFQTDALGEFEDVRNHQ